MPWRETLLPLPETPGYTWRFARRMDLSSVYDLFEASCAVDQKLFNLTLADLYMQFEDPWSQPNRDYLVALGKDGEVAAISRVYMRPGQGRDTIAFLEIEVHPARRDTCLREAALKWALRRGSQKLAGKPFASRRVYRIACNDQLRDNILLYESYGFRPARHFFRMQRDLDQPFPQADLQPGYRLEMYRPELDRSLLRAYNESFKGHWGFEPVSEEELRLFFLTDAAFHPELSFIVTEGHRGEIAGFSLNFVNPPANARLGLAEGWIAELGVRPHFRKQGIASALLCRSMAGFKAANLKWTGLNVDAENASGALSIYRRLGFNAIKTNIAFEKPYTG